VITGRGCHGVSGLYSGRRPRNPMGRYLSGTLVLALEKYVGRSVGLDVK
jgi:hypothetical protein